ncbi:MAG: hypothetical protein V2I62_11475 [Bacteroidales bacterium]|jgi:hypothetical protein|nr:hypothetical protein [Bacteroidales bacterium]
MKTKACVGCGYCCMKRLCDAALRLYGNIKECPQLLWDEEKNRYICGLMIISGKVGLGYREELGAGAGCCSSLNSWRNDVKKRTGIETSTFFNPLPSLMQKFIRCLASEFISADTIILTLERFESMLKKRRLFRRRNKRNKNKYCKCI